MKPAVAQEVYCVKSELFKQLSFAVVFTPTNKKQGWFENEEKSNCYNLGISYNRVVCRLYYERFCRIISVAYPGCYPDARGNS